MRFPPSLNLPFDKARGRVDQVRSDARRLDDLFGALTATPTSDTSALRTAGLPQGTELMVLGMFVFGMKSLPYQEFQRRMSWRHATSERHTERPAAQYVGLGEDTVSFTGVLVPEVAGSFGAIDNLVDMASTGDNWPLLDGAGQIWGSYRIENIDLRGTSIISGGIARRTEFAVDLVRQD
jgi:hypothetical protein